MKLPFFIAQKISKNKQATFSRFILRLATLATALSVAVMVIALCVVDGFKTQIREKMFVFWGHAQITLFNANPSSLIGDRPFNKDKELEANVLKEGEVSQVFPFVLKPGILKSSSGMEGLKMKGIDAAYPQKSGDAITFSGKGIQFTTPDYSREIIVSETSLSRLKLKIGDSALLVFFNPEQGNPTVRKMYIAGTYHTGIEEVDQYFALCDIRLLQSLNRWGSQEISAYQIHYKDFRKADLESEQIYQKYITPPMSIATVKDLYPFIFSWVDFQDTNAAIILVIMATVAAINMATALLIYILERTAMVGTLKALGMRNASIQQIFVIHALSVVGKGIALGLIFGLGFCVLQDQFQWIKLDETVYYMKAAPIAFNFLHIGLVALGTLTFCGIILLIPALIVKRVKIVDALKF